jgi:MoxR-like ATPase
LARFSPEALNEALERLFALRFSTKKQSFTASYLTAKRIEARGESVSIAAANSVVTELFELIPSSERGRIAPFREYDPTNSWLVSEQSGRKTVWDYCTRTGSGRVMFVDDHMSNGLGADALDKLLETIGLEIPLQPLAVLLLRDKDWAAEPDSDELKAELEKFLSISSQELDRLTVDAPLETPLIGDTEWSPDSVLARFPGAAVAAAAAVPSTGSHDLASLVAEWRGQTGYPTQHDEQQRASREGLAEILSKDALENAAAEPGLFQLSEFRRIAGTTYGGAGNQAQMNVYLKDKGEEGVQRLVGTIHHLLYGDGDDASRLDDVLGETEWRLHGFSEALATKCLAITFPETWIPLFVFDGPNGKKAIMELPELPLSPPDESGASRGSLIAESNRELRDLLEPYIPSDPWGKMVFLWWLLGRSKTTDVRITRPVEGLKQLAEQLYLDREWLEEVVELLDDKKQVIFYGPPGTGKTFVARRLARFLAPDEKQRRTVQFHPSYSYEDFVWGYRPVFDDGHGVLRYDLVDGPLKELAQEASESEDKARDRHILLIDEINRANVAKVFGELYYLLEYREDELLLQYSPISFRLPENLYVVGTMNTADRSIGVIDAALRRRFHFIEFFPDSWPIEGLLGRWLADNKPGMAYVADVVDLANSMLQDRNLQIGPSHFMRANLDDRWLGMIWRHSVLPYVEEQYYDEPQRIGQFGLEALREKLEASGGSNAPGPTDAELVGEDAGAETLEVNQPEGVDEPAG